LSVEKVPFTEERHCNWHPSLSEKLSTEYYRETKSALKAIESQSLHRETLSAPKVYHNKPKYKTEDQFMSLSADIHRRGDNQLRVETPPYRVNQTIMYRTIFTIPINTI
jgi:hypothetical protein